MNNNGNDLIVLLNTGELIYLSSQVATTGNNENKFPLTLVP